MPDLYRVTPNKATAQNIEAIYNEKGQMLDVNTKEVLIQGQIDKGHKPGYEERAMRLCAERCHMTQKEYRKMMQDPRLYQFESSHNNRSHKFESKDYVEQLHKCFEVIRNYKGRNRNKVHEKYGKSDFTFSSKAKTPNFNHSQNTVTSGKTQSSYNSHTTSSSKTSGNGFSTTGSHGGSLSGGRGGLGSSGGIGGHGSSFGHGGGHGSGSSGGGHGGHGGMGGGHGR